MSLTGNATEQDFLKKKYSGIFGPIYLFILFILFLMLTITEQMLFAIKNSNKMLIDVNTLVKKPIEHNIPKKRKNKKIK